MAQLVEALRVRFPMCSLRFFNDLTLPAALRPRDISWDVKATGA
jgi:hypothetical protein